MRLLNALIAIISWGQILGAVAMWFDDLAVERAAKFHVSAPGAFADSLTLAVVGNAHGHESASFSGFQESVVHYRMPILSAGNTGQLT